MRFHLLSDLHIEFAEFQVEKVEGCDYLILAGDIGTTRFQNYVNLIERAAGLYKTVFVVKGNHECYGFTVDQTSNKIAKICNKFENVVYLNNKAYDVEGTDVRVIGTTLWSNINDYERFEISTFIADFRCIKDWTIDENNHKHYKAVQFIKNELQRALDDSKRLVVVTHHAPYTKNTSREEHRGSTLSSAFATDLSGLIKSPVVSWAYGHTHHSNQQLVNGVLLVSNQRGYDGEKTNFDPLFTFEI